MEQYELSQAEIKKAEETVMTDEQARGYGYQVSTELRKDKAFTKEDNTLVGGDKLLFMRTQELLKAQVELAFKAGAKAQLDKIPYLNKWMELLEQTRGKCITCGSCGKVYNTYPSDLMHTCSDCNGSGKGEVRPEMIVVLAEDQSLPKSYEGNKPRAKAFRDMLNNNFKRISE